MGIVQPGTADLGSEGWGDGQEIHLILTHRSGVPGRIRAEGASVQQVHEKADVVAEGIADTLFYLTSALLILR